MPDKSLIKAEIKSAIRLIDDYEAIQSDMSCNDGQVWSGGVTAMLDVLTQFIDASDDSDPFVEKLAGAIAKARKDR